MAKSANVRSDFEPFHHKQIAKYIFSMSFDSVLPCFLSNLAFVEPPLESHPFD